jgi:hypothetical protein
MNEHPRPWPLEWRPNEQSFYVRTLTARFQNPYTRHVQVLERDGALWVSRLAIRAGEPRKARAIDGFLGGLRGVVGVLMPDFRRRRALGSLAGAPRLVAGAGRTLQIDGFTPGAAGVLAAGDLIQTSFGRVHMVTDPVDADDTGAATVKMVPRLREAVTAGPLQTTDCRVLMRLADDDAGRNQSTPPIRTAYELDFVEILPE